MGYVVIVRLICDYVCRIVCRMKKFSMACVKIGRITMCRIT